ncbi:unnamed protein product [Ixodes persulcatus]
MRRVLHEATEEEVKDEMTAYTGCPLCNLNNIVFFIGIASAVTTNVLFFFFFFFFFFFCLACEICRSSRALNFFENCLASLVALHDVVDLMFHFIASSFQKRKAYILPWIITSIIECAVLFKSSIFLGLQSVPASAWIIATTVAFFSVQLFYIACVILYFRRLKKMEREIQPPEVYKC